MAFLHVIHTPYDDYYLYNSWIPKNNHRANGGDTAPPLLAPATPTSHIPDTLTPLDQEGIP
jgi:hypothetical protein